MSEPDTAPCPTCHKPALADYPHHHETPPRPDYDPMPVRPALRAMAEIIRAEVLAELPVRLHVIYVPSQTAPVPGLGEVLDIGPLGAPSFAPDFARRIGAIRLWGGESTVAAGELADVPWTRNLEGMRGYCARHHAAWYEHQSRPLCWILLRHVVFGGYSPERAGDLEGVGAAVGVRLVLGHEECDGDHPGQCPRGALERLWGWISNDLNGLDLRRRKMGLTTTTDAA